MVHFRCNGLVPPSSIAKTRTVGQINYPKLVKSLGTKDTYNNETKLEPTFKTTMGFTHSPLHNHELETKVKIEFDEEEIDAKIISPSIIGSYYISKSFLEVK